MNFIVMSWGCKQLINAGNWKSASEARLGDLERWTYGASEVIAVNKYYNGGRHVGPDNGWRINPGGLFPEWIGGAESLGLADLVEAERGEADDHYGEYLGASAGGIRVRGRF